MFCDINGHHQVQEAEAAEKPTEIRNAPIFDPVHASHAEADWGISSAITDHVGALGTFVP